MIWVAIVNPKGRNNPKSRIQIRGSEREGEHTAAVDICDSVLVVTLNPINKQGGEEVGSEIIPYKFPFWKLNSPMADYLFKSRPSVQNVVWQAKLHMPSLSLWHVQLPLWNARLGVQLLPPARPQTWTLQQGRNKKGSDQTGFAGFNASSRTTSFITCPLLH